ncbi:MULTISPECIES: nucleotidyltransferase family protein [Ochrobactrum]|uniref:nucleotidyltransferase family protein n=1 Tax=Ochrobactrum TaxID=528 RepID=UPI0037C991CE
MRGAAKIAILVLAAGKSRRFGAGNKLLSRYNGKPLAAHVAASLQGLPFSFGVIVASDPSVAGLFRHTGLRPLFPKNSSTQSQSLRAGLQYVKRRGASHALLLLGDMPYVPRQHLRTMMAKAGPHPLMSHNGKSSLPPALIPQHLFGKLQHLHGDTGAGGILMRHPSTVRLPLDSRQAVDVDTKTK